MNVLSCPRCARPYEGDLVPGTRVHCLCSHVFTVEASEVIARRVTCGHCGAPVSPDAKACGHCRVALRTQVCPGCFGRMPEGARHCQKCGKQLDAQKLQRIPNDASCPRCEGELFVRILEDASIVECEACHGIWVEPDTFDRLCWSASNRPVGVPPAPDGALDNPVPYIPCLGCGELMVRRQFRWQDRPAAVVLDYCRHHGVWFDGEELERVLAFVAAHAGAPRPSAPVPIAADALRSSAGVPERRPENLWQYLLSVLSDWAA